MTAIAIQRKAEILERLEAGEFITHIAREYGVERSTLSQYLRNDPDYQAARETGWETRLDDGLKKIAEAGDDINLARAREIALRRMEWRAEREFPGRWGAKQEQATPAVTIVIQRFGGAEPGPVVSVQRAGGSLVATPTTE